MLDPLIRLPQCWAFGCSRIGASHQRERRPCQDAFALWAGSASGTPYLIAAVADGHGSARHDLSQFGADLAVRAAVVEMQGFASAFLGDERGLVQTFRADFARRLSRRWRSEVDDDANRRG